MKLIQLNVWWGCKLANKVSEFLEREQPDILCLQESASLKKGDAGLFLTNEKIQKLITAEYSAFAPLITFNFMHKSIGMGNAIISKFSIKKQFTEYTNLQHNENFDFDKHDYNIRNFIHTEIELNKSILNVVTHHGHHVPDHKNGNSETLRQMKQLREYISSLSGPVILTGDFNLSPNSKSLNEINSILKNLSVACKLETTRTPLTNKIEVCDYIFVNDQVKVKKFKASDDIISDHKALILNFDL